LIFERFTVNVTVFICYKILMNIFEIIGIIAGLSASVPSIPQIIQTLKTKDVK